MDNFKESEFIRLVKRIMKIENCSFEEVAEQLVLAGQGPGKYKQENIVEKEHKNEGEVNAL